MPEEKKQYPDFSKLDKPIAVKDGLCATIEMLAGQTARDAAWIVGHLIVAVRYFAMRSGEMTADEFDAMVAKGQRSAEVTASEIWKGN